MEHQNSRSVYSFSGNWFPVFERMVSLIQPFTGQRFTVLVPKNKNKDKEQLLVLYGINLPDVLIDIYSMTPSRENGYSLIQNNPGQYWIHGYNEFKKKGKQGLVIQM